MIPCKFVAEVSSNHNNDLKRAFLFIKAAADCGCDAVKFQLFKIDELFAPEILQGSEKHRDRKKWELPIEFLGPLKECCLEHGLDFSCTPFYLKAVDELYPYVDFYKIASYELLWDGLIRVCAQTGKPLVISTGMADLDEISHAVEVAEAAGCKNLTLLHCVSDYPVRPPYCNLAFIKTIREQFGLKAGWSDHSVSEAVVYRAVHAWQASMVEFHIDLDSKGYEYGSGHCWLPESIKNVIHNVRIGENSDGRYKKELCQSEIKERQWRADPSDGLRPFLEKRRNFGKKAG